MIGDIPHGEFSEEVITLEALKRNLSMVIDPYLVNDLQMSVRDLQYQDPTKGREFALNIRRTFYGETRVDQISHSFASPASWWQHFKLEHFPAWLLRRFPARYVSQTQTTDLRTEYEFPKAYRPGNHYLDKFIIHQAIVEPGPQVFGGLK